MANIEKLLAGGAELLGLPGQEQATSPVQFGTPAQQEEQQPSQDAALDFFSAAPGVSASAPEYKFHRERWWANFADQYHDRDFSSLEDYIDFVSNLKDATTGEIVSGEEIRNFAIKQALDFMPPKLKSEYQQRQAMKEDELNFERMKSRAQRFNSDPENKRAGMFMAMDGKTVKVDPNIEFKRKLDLASGIQKQMSDITKQMSDVRKAFKDNPSAGKAEINRLNQLYAFLFEEQLKIYGDAATKDLVQEAEGKDTSTVVIEFPDGRVKTVPRHILEKTPLPEGAVIR